MRFLLSTLFLMLCFSVHAHASEWKWVLQEDEDQIFMVFNEGEELYDGGSYPRFFCRYDKFQGVTYKYIEFLVDDNDSKKAKLNLKKRQMIELLQNKGVPHAYFQDNKGAILLSVDYNVMDGYIMRFQIDDIDMENLFQDNALNMTIGSEKTIIKFDFIDFDQIKKFKQSCFELKHKKRTPAESK